MYTSYGLKVIRLIQSGFVIISGIFLCQIMVLIVISNSAYLIPFLDGTFGLILAYFFMLFIGYYESTELNATRVALSSILGTIAFISICISSFVSYSTIVMISSPTFIIFFVYFVVEVTNSLKKIALFANSSQIILISYLKKFVIWSFGGISGLYFINTIEIGVENSNTISDFSYFITSTAVPIFYLISVGYFYLGYISPNDPTIMQAQKLDKLIIMTPSGIPIFDYEFQKSVKGIDSTLLSGALTAISAVIKEAAPIAGELEMIKLGNQYVMFEIRANLSVVLVTYKPSLFLKAGIHKLGDNISDVVSDTAVLTDIDDKLIKSLMVKILGS